MFKTRQRVQVPTSCAVVPKLALKCGLFSALMAVSPVTAWGAEPEEDQLFNMSLQELLEVEVSTASKISGSADKSPANMTVITQEDIRRYGYRNLGEALQRVPGFLTNQFGEATMGAIRGLSPQNNNANARILIMIDGLRYNTWLLDEAMLTERFPLDIESIERIEVLKGAGSAVWGSNAVYGVVNVISKDSDSKRNRQLMGELASKDRGKGYFSHAGETEGGFKYFASVSATTQDDNMNAFYPALADLPDTNGGISGGEYEQQGHHGNVKLSYEDFYSNIVWGYNEVTLSTNLDYGFEDGGTQNYQEVPVRAEVGHTWDIWKEMEGELLWRVTHSYDRFKGLSHFAGPTGPGYIAMNQNFTSVNTTGSELRYSQNLTDTLKGVIGTEFNRTYEARTAFDTQEYSPENDTVYDDSFGFNQDRSAMAYFFDLAYSPLEEISFYGGGRFDHYYQENIDTAFGPRLGVVAEPVDGTILKLLYSQGFRAPNIGERTILVATPRALDNESVDTYEFVAQQVANEWLNLKGSVFYTELSDTIAVVNSEDGTPIFTNLDGFRTRGVELEAVARVDKDLQGYTTFAYSEGTDRTTGEDVDYIPHYTARLGVSAGFEDAFVIASPEIQFGSSSEAASGYEFDEYFITNLTLVSYPLYKGFQLSAAVYNMFDKKYVRPGGSYSFDPVFTERSPENGRMFRLQGSWTF